MGQRETLGTRVGGSEYTSELGILAAKERLRRRRCVASGLGGPNARGLTNGLAPARASSRPLRRPRPAWGIVVVLAGAAFLLAPLYALSLPSEGGGIPEGPSSADAGLPPAAPDAETAATYPPTWPSQWTLLVTDPDVGVNGRFVDIVDVRWGAGGWNPYLYLRILTGATALWESWQIDLATHSWWVYLALGGGNNDWIIEERSFGICSLAWNQSAGTWGIRPGCDVVDTLTDADVGSAVRIVKCTPSFYCVDFAIEVSDYPGLYGLDVVITAAVDAIGDRDLYGDASWNPRNAQGGCDPPDFDDCAPPAWIYVPIPEFPSFLAVALVVPAILAVRRRRADRPPQRPEA